MQSVECKVWGLEFSIKAKDSGLGAFDLLPISRPSPCQIRGFKVEISRYRTWGQGMGFIVWCSDSHH